MTCPSNKIKEIRAALEVYDSDFALDADLIDLAPDMARIVLEQVEEIERLRKRVKAADALFHAVVRSKQAQHYSALADATAAYLATESGE